MAELVESAQGAPISKKESLLCAVMWLWLFLTICVYYMLRPVRSALVMSTSGAHALPWIYMGTALATGAAAYLFGRCAGVGRKRLIAGTLGLFVACLFVWWFVAGWAQAARLAGASRWSWSPPAFYIWTDVFSIVSVTVFWMYANDVFAAGSAKRVFGLITSGGPAGAILGAWLTESLVVRIGTVNMLLVAAGVYLGVLALFLWLESIWGGRCGRRPEASASPADLSRVREIFRLIVSTRVLLLLTAVVGFERMVPDFVDYAFQALAHGAHPGMDAYARFFAGFEKWRNIGVLAAASLATAPLLAGPGVGITLSTVPATILACGSLFLLAPGMGTVLLLKGLEEGQRHAWFKAAKETVYTVAGRDVIYRVKGYVDMFLYRLCRGIAGFILLVLQTAGFGPTACVAASLPLALVWLCCAWKLGGEYQRLEREGSSGA